MLFRSLAMSNAFIKLSNKLKRDGDELSPARAHLVKTLPSALAIFIVFMFVGLWHGANSKYVGFGAWNGAVLMLSMLLKPALLRLGKFFYMNDNFLWNLFRMLRTFIITAYWLVQIYAKLPVLGNTRLQNKETKLKDVLYNIYSHTSFLEEGFYKVII